MAVTRGAVWSYTKVLQIGQFRAVAEAVEGAGQQQVFAFANQAAVQIELELARAVFVGETGGAAVADEFDGRFRPGADMDQDGGEVGDAVGVIQAAVGSGVNLGSIGGGGTGGIDTEGNHNLAAADEVRRVGAGKVHLGRVTRLVKQGDRWIDGQSIGIIGQRDRGMEPDQAGEAVDGLPR